MAGYSSTPGQFYDPYFNAAKSTPTAPLAPAPYSSGGYSYNGMQSVTPQFNNPSPSGQILGTHTDANSNTNSTAKGFDMKYYSGWNPQAAIADRNATGGSKANQPNPQQGGGDGGYGDYLKSFDDQITGLGDQRGAQEGIANNTYNQGLNTVNSQYASSQADLEANKQRTLRDLSNNLQQSWQGGNQYLGTRGASDSSAANQYAFALTKLGNQQRGDVQGQYDQNLFKLKNTYDTETKNLELQKNSQLQQISQWFAEAQNTLRGQKGQVAFQQSQQALNTAMQLAQQVKQEAAQRRATLDTWAANHSANFAQLGQNLSQVGAFQMNAPQIGGPTAQPGAFSGVSAGYGGNTTKKDIFGNVIQ